MATLARSKVTLRIAGDSLIPEEITRLLGGTPTEAQRKGEELVGPSGVARTAKFGMWRLRASETTPADLNAQVQEVLAQLTDDIAVWDQLASRYDIDLFCGWFMERENERVGISVNTLRQLGARSIELSLDIYSGDKDEGDSRESDERST